MFYIKEKIIEKGKTGLVVFKYARNIIGILGIEVEIGCLFH